MKYILGSLTIEVEDQRVTVIVSNIGGPGSPARIRKLRKKSPEALEIAKAIAEIRGSWPDDAVLFACSRAAHEAKK